MIAFAVRHNLRIVRVNLRDYPGSTPYSPAELEVIHNGSYNEQVAFVKARGLELGAFLAWLIRTTDIPAPSDNKTPSGGLSVLAWSAGNCVTVSLFAHAESLPAEDQELLSRYILSYILFGAYILLKRSWALIPNVFKDPAFYAMGVPSPPLTEISSPLRDPDIPPSELPVQFAKWVSGYYHHDALHTSIFSTISRTELLSRSMQHSPSSPPPSEQATIERMSLDTLAAVADIEGIGRSHLPVASKIDHNIYAKNLRAALVPNALRNVRFELVWCEMSIPDTGYASWALVNTMKELSNPRNVRMWTFEGANHFVSLSAPERTFTYLTTYSYCN